MRAEALEHAQQYVDRVKTLEEILDRSRLESLSVRNESRSVTDVAQEILKRCVWLA